MTPSSKMYRRPFGFYLKKEGLPSQLLGYSTTRAPCFSTCPGPEQPISQTRTARQSRTSSLLQPQRSSYYSSLSPLLHSVSAIQPAPIAQNTQSGNAHDLYHPQEQPMLVRPQHWSRVFHHSWTHRWFSFSKIGLKFTSKLTSNWGATLSPTFVEFTCTEITLVRGVIWHITALWSCSLEFEM